jgi:hypothetical protein
MDRKANSAADPQSAPNCTQINTIKIGAIANKMTPKTYCLCIGNIATPVAAKTQRAAPTINQSM